MAVKRKERLLNAVPSATPGTTYSAWVNTENFKNFSFVLRMGGSDYTSTDVADTIDFWIEASDTNDSAQAYYKRRALSLTNAQTGTVAKKFTQVTGNTPLPATPASYTDTTLRQQWDYKSPNVDEYVRLAYTTASNPELLGTVIVDMYADEEV